MLPAQQQLSSATATAFNSMTCTLSWHTQMLQETHYFLNKQWGGHALR
jgi:hypothetical protein